MSTPSESLERERSVASTPTADGTPQRYAGLATRTIAAVLDAALINLVAVIVGVGASLIISLLHIPHKLNAALIAIGGAAYVVWTLGYFISFWATTGQTPGDRLMQVRVVTADGDPLKPRRAFVRCVGVVLAALPLFAGFLLILFDDRRRGLQDRIARTVVIDAPQLSVAAQLRARNRAEKDGSRERQAATAADADKLDGGGPATPTLQRSSVSGDAGVALFLDA
jgi:uncharacterized RDD family membrane protein YckC